MGMSVLTSLLITICWQVCYNTKVLFLILIYGWLMASYMYGSVPYPCYWVDLYPPPHLYTSVLSGFWGLWRLSLYHVVSTFVILTLKVLCFEATPLFQSLYIYATDFPAGLVLCSGTCYSDQKVATTPEAHRYQNQTTDHDPYPGLWSLPKTTLQIKQLLSKTEILCFYEVQKGQISFFQGGFCEIKWALFPVPKSSF